MLVPAYATTIFIKARLGYPAVVIPVMTQHYTMLSVGTSLYTGVNARQESGRAGRPEERPSDRSAQHLGRRQVVEAPSNGWQNPKGNQILASD